MPNLVDTFSNVGENTVGTDQIVNGSIVNTDVSGAAALGLSKLANITAGSVLMGNASNVPTATVISGDITVSSSGVTAIAASAIVNADINGAAAIDKTKISGTAITAADTGTVTSTMIADGTILNADVNASAAIALSKLANATAGQVLLGTTTTGVVTATTITGDVTVTGAGVTAISSGVILNADVNASAAIDKTKISGTAITAADTGTVTSTMIADGSIVNADVNTAAAIAHSKLANATAGQVLLGTTTTGVVTATTISGDITINGAGVATIAANSVALGTDTTGNYVATISGTANQVTISGSGSESAAVTVSLPQDIATTSNPTFAGLTADNIKVGVTGANEIDTVSGDLTIDSAGGTVTIDDNLTVTGNLTVSGTTTTINTTNLSIADNEIVLNSDVTGSPTENAGIIIERGTSSDVNIRWNETTDRWQLTNDGTNYGNILVAGDSAVITSLMIADGAIVTGDIASNAITTANILDSNVTAAKLASDAVTTSKILDANVTTAKIANDSVTQAKLADRAVGSAELDNLTLNAQTGTTYTLVLADAHKLVTQSNASAITTTIPPNSSVAFEIGDQVNLLQLGAGQVTVAAGSGVTIRSEGSKLKLKGQYAAATCIKIASDEWVLVGNLSA